jgi:hypothetical protein
MNTKDAGDEMTADPQGLVSEHIRHLAQAEAALMLVECVMLTLIERGVVVAEDMLEATEISLQTKRRMIEEGSHPAISTVAAGMLKTIANSLAAARYSAHSPAADACDRTGSVS